MKKILLVLTFMLAFSAQAWNQNHNSWDTLANHTKRRAYQAAVRRGERCKRPPSKSSKKLQGPVVWSRKPPKGSQQPAKTPVVVIIF